MLPAPELVEAFIRLRGNLPAFEAEANLPAGMLTGMPQATHRGVKPDASRHTANGHSTGGDGGDAAVQKATAGEEPQWPMQTATLDTAVMAAWQAGGRDGAALWS